MALAVLLHAAVVLALWWMSLTPPKPSVEEPIDITFEQPKPEPPPPPPEPEKPPLPPQQAMRQPQPPPPPPPADLGLRPPAPITSDKPTQVPPSGDKPNLPPSPPPPMEQAVPAPDPEPPPPTQSEFAKSAPKLPPLQAPPSPSKEQHALAAPQSHAPPTPQPARPQAPPVRPPPPELRPSPLTTAPTYQPPGGTPRNNGSTSPFVNPADVYARARVRDNYLWEVVRKLIGYSYNANVKARQGMTVVRVVIARDGRLLDAGVAQSSGYPEFDRGALAGVRAGAPYSPLPAEIKGDSATFDLPLVSVNRQ